MRPTPAYLADRRAPAAVAVAALGFAVFGTGTLHLLGDAPAEAQTEGDWHSIPGFISSPAGHRPIAAMSPASCSPCAFVGRLRLAAAHACGAGELDWIDGAGWATLALLVTASSLLPWYVAWLMPLAALGTDRRLWRAALVITGVVLAIQLLGFIPHGASLLGL